MMTTNIGNQAHSIFIEKGNGARQHRNDWPKAFSTLHLTPAGRFFFPVAGADPPAAALLLQRDEARGGGGPDARAAVGHGLVGDRELAEVEADHLGLHLHQGVLVAVVHTQHGADHLGQDEHVAQVGLHGLRALALGGGLLGLAQALEEGAVLALEAARPAHLSAGAGVEQLSQLIGADGQELVQVDAPELELLEHSLPLGCVSHGFA
mmetsp:Transcript_12847/g.22922  ORF Transcript_12847/g.22922 Transcript_12847/m.22922 type:complete len:208 (-) Transcript_12847:71-694(-)